jgi:hypothetical protein
VPLAAAIRAVEKLSKRGRDNNLKALELGYSLDLEAANLVSQK